MILLATGFLETLIQWDHALFKAINTGFTNPVFDAVMPFVRTSLYWIPLYVFLLAFAAINFKTKGLWWIVFFLVTVALCDATGTNLFKYTFDRTRPCNNPEFIGQLRLLVVCPSGYGFTSNHAANHFGMATFIFISFRHISKFWSIAAFVWAASIGYAQIYVGIHYPADVACGALIGIIYGTFTGYQFNKHFRLQKPSAAT